MRRKFTVYGLRFSKATFWNRLNAGFLESAVATVLTACGIETWFRCCNFYIQFRVATVLTACGIETLSQLFKVDSFFCSKLQQYLPLAVLKLNVNPSGNITSLQLQQYLPLAVLKRYTSNTLGL